jgi:hypothetical protein
MCKHVILKKKKFEIDSIKISDTILQNAYR